MKIKTLLLSTVVATGLSTGAMAADLGVLTSLDVCDELGISGLTISSDSNCLQISGEVKYEFNWGDWTIPVAGAWLHAPDSNGGITDWTSTVDAWLKFVATAESDFGPAKAVIKFGYDEDYTVLNNIPVGPTGGGLVIDEAYVSVGDSTVLMAGKKGSIANVGGDTAYNWLGLRHDNDSSAQNLGLNGVTTGGHVIQLTSDLGNGVDVAVGLEDLGGLGSLIGVLNYSGDTVAGHITIGADDILTGTVREWAVHAGAEVTVDNFKFLAAVAFNSVNTWAQSGWSVMASAKATFDMFTLAASVSASNDGAALVAPVIARNNLEIAASISADVTDTVTVKLGAQWDDHDTTTATDEQWKVAAAVVAKVSENVTVTGEVGVDGEVATPTTVAYGSVEAAWAPGGGFTSSVKGLANAAGLYKITFKAKKSF